MVPYEPHCTFHWDHFYIWQKYARGITRSTRIGEMDHRRQGMPRSYVREFGYNLWVTHTLSRRGPVYDPMKKYASWHPALPSTVHWPTAEECFWECTHPMQWTSRLHADDKEYSPFYEHRRLRDALSEIRSWLYEILPGVCVHVCRRCTDDVLSGER